MAQQEGSDTANFNITINTVYSKGTYNLLRLVTKGLLKESQNSEYVLHSSFERAARLTGLPKERLMDIMTENDIDNEIMKQIDRKTVHYELSQFYMTERTWPTCIQFFNRIQFNIPYHVDIQTFQDILVSFGYILKRKGNMTVIMENPNLRFERYMYLKNIVRYRENVKEIYFIGEFSIVDKRRRVLNLEESHLSNKESSLHYICAVSAESDQFIFNTVEAFNEDTFRCFIINRLLPHLVRPSLIIYDNAKHHNESYCNRLVSLESSLKSEILEWLQYHDIPYASDMSKLQLWTLAESCTDITANVFTIDELLKHNGHEVLRLPDSINDLSLIAGVRQCITKNLKELKVSDAVSKESLIKYNNALITEESNLLDLELELDVILDNLGDPVVDPLSDNTAHGEDLELPSACENE